MRNKVFILNSRFKFYSKNNKQNNKEQMSYQGTETCHFDFEVKNKVKEPDTKFLLSHGNGRFDF